MLVEKYNDAYFESIVELEKQVYPKSLCYGSDMLKDELGKAYNYSKVVLSKGKIVGYIISYDSTLAICGRSKAQVAKNEEKKSRFV